MDAAANEPDVLVFHAGTAERDGALVANGGRVLAVTGIGKDVRQAQQRAYAAIAKSMAGWFLPQGYRWRAIARD